MLNNWIKILKETPKTMKKNHLVLACENFIFTK